MQPPYFVRWIVYSIGDAVWLLLLGFLAYWCIIDWWFWLMLAIPILAFGAFYVWSGYELKHGHHHSWMEKDDIPESFEISGWMAFIIGCGCIVAMVWTLMH